MNRPLFQSDEQAALNGPILPRRRVVDDSEMDITPMIDITFLLLIFFLVASKMDSDANVPLPLAKNGTAVTVKNSAVITMVPAGSDRVTVYLGEGTDDNRRVTAGDLAQQEVQIADYVQQMLGEGRKQQVIVKAAKSVKHRDVARVMQAAGQAGDARVYVAVLHENR